MILLAAVVTYATLMLGVAVVHALAWYTVTSLVSLSLYAADKRASVRRRSRTPEATLLAIDALGGFPGGFAGQRVFRHKTAKPAYQVAFWVATVIHVAASWLFLAA